MNPTNGGDERLALLRLSLVPGVGAIKAATLLATFGSATATWRASATEIERCTDRAVAMAIAAGIRDDDVERVLRWAGMAATHHVLVHGDADYPPALRHIADPPLVLYAIGDLARLAAPSLAIVGSRNATAQGRADAFHFARALSDEGICIVSGMALGIDAAAHEGGLAGAASSVAVVGTGIDRVYPDANRALAGRLREQGCVVSDFALGTPPRKGNFPARNRLISGLALGVLVVEAALESGSLVTARCALDQDREVFAIPGSIHSPLSKGCHSLIQQGAKLTQCVDDILCEIGRERAARTTPDARATTADPLLDLMGFAPISLERLAASSGLGVARTAQALSRLELDGAVALLPGGLFQRMGRSTA